MREQLLMENRNALQTDAKIGNDFLLKVSCNYTRWVIEAIRSGGATQKLPG
jgi:hypothetical protein